MPRRDFTTATPPDVDPIEFGYAGQVFRCSPTVERETLAAVAAGLLNVPQPDWADFDAESLRYIGRVIDFIRSVVDEEAQFLATIARQRIDDDTLAEIFGFLAGEYAERLGPIEPSKPVPTRPNSPLASERGGPLRIESHPSGQSPGKPRTTLDQLASILTSPKAGSRAIGEIG